MKTFTAIDFETAQGYRWSICQVGLIRVENGIITKELDILVQPPNNYYWDIFTGMHGISSKDTLLIADKMIVDLGLRRIFHGEFRIDDITLSKVFVNSSDLMEGMRIRGKVGKLYLC